jgi:hypothetical protein
MLNVCIIIYVDPQAEKPACNHVFFSRQKSSYKSVVLSQHNVYILHKYHIQIKSRFSYNRGACRVEDLLLSSLRSFSNTVYWYYTVVYTAKVEELYNSE